MTENENSHSAHPKPILMHSEGQTAEKQDSVSQNAEMESQEKESQISERMKQLLALKDRIALDTDQLSRRFMLWILIFVLGIGFLGTVLYQIHYYLVGRYAVLADVSVTQNPANQGQLDISYEIISPGRIHLCRTSGELETEIIYEYQKTGSGTQHWNWNYVPGKPIDLSLWSRRGIRGNGQKFQFPTSDVADIVILIDTTESMDASINTLKEKCADFALMLERQAVKPRFALVGFGDAALGGAWVQQTEFTQDVLEFQDQVANIARFQGGDLSESVLDALSLAIEKVKKNSEGHVIRFYLVTDQAFHPQTADGSLNTAAVARALEENRVMLEVFSHPRFRAQYEPLLGTCGRFREIENFGEVLSQGRFLED